MDYTEACTFVWGLASANRRGDTEPARFGLQRITTLLTRLGDPHVGMYLAHIAGTKGKGSTCAMLASIMQRSGKRVGLYTSPHLHSVRERIVIDGSPVSRESFATAVGATAAAAYGLVGLSPFEALTATAFFAFREAGVTAAAIEVGLGGRLDATNVITPCVTAIASISHDHTEVLGSTLAQIAAEKAGIMKPGVPVFSAEQEDVAAAVIEARAAALGCRLEVVGRDWHLSDLAADAEAQSFSLAGPKRANPLADGQYVLPLLGEYQAENAALALAAAETVAPALGLGSDDLRRGLAAVRWPGRLEVLARQPLVVVDGAHNVDSMWRLGAAIERHFAPQRLRLVFGAAADKDIGGMLRVAPKRATLYACSSGDRRSSPADSVLAAGLAAGLEGAAFASVGDALWQAVADALPGECVCVCGSLYVAAAAREAWARRFGEVRESNGEVEVVSLGDAWRKWLG